MYRLLPGLTEGHTQWRFEDGYCTMQYWKEEEWQFSLN